MNHPRPPAADRPQASVREPSRTIPVAGSFDVVVVGGGIAGVAAAVAAARHSARVCLVEKHQALGGLATLGNVTIWLPLCDGKGNQVISGMGEELLKLSVADLEADHPKARFCGIPACWKGPGTRDARSGKRYLAEFNPAAYLLALETWVTRAGVTLLYDTRFCAVRRRGRRISHVIVENKSGRSAIAGRVVVDATGDADVCFSAGEETVSLDSNVPAGWFYTLRAGELTLHQHSNPYCPLGTKEGGKGPFFRGDDAAQVTAHLLATRENVRERIRQLRAAGHGADLQLIMPATIACFRMTRRLAGRFTLAEKDAHRWFDDAVGFTGDWRRAGPVYAIPFGCLCGVRTDNLLAAGRCVSADNTVWDVMRAIPPCAVTGEAAGTAAALAALDASGNVTSVPPGALQDRLRARGVLLDSALLSC